MPKKLPHSQQGNRNRVFVEGEPIYIRRKEFSEVAPSKMCMEIRKSFLL